MTKPIHPTALFRLSVLGELCSRNSFEHGELKSIIKRLSQQTYNIPGSKRVHLSAKTIENWYYAWLKQGIDGLVPKTRRDKGRVLPLYNVGYIAAGTPKSLTFSQN